LGTSPSANCALILLVARLACLQRLPSLLALLFLSWLQQLVRAPSVSSGEDDDCATPAPSKCLRPGDDPRASPSPLAVDAVLPWLFPGGKEERWNLSWVQRTHRTHGPVPALSSPQLVLFVGILAFLESGKFGDFDWMELDNFACSINNNSSDQVPSHVLQLYL
jgi:hypothetical protein